MARAWWIAGRGVLQGTSSTFSWRALLTRNARPLSGESDNGAGSRVRVYTRTGDKGVSSTFSGQRVPKDEAIFEALGTTDELSCMIGLAREFCLDHSHHDISHRLQEIQCVLQDVGSHVATPRTQATETKLTRTTFGDHHVETLEQWIDTMDEELPALTNFILPSGGKSSAVLHVARSICRRAERRVIPLYRDGQVEQSVAKYLNRLSDFLFMAARLAAQAEGKKETIYRRVERENL